jgi:tRNA threonylcarbamoyladenosine biosynthesis protein TsaB
VIIAIESASTDSSLALLEPGGAPIGLDGWSGTPGQGRELMPRLDELISRHGRHLHDATAVAVGTGPGSFTGLRVGMSVAKGLALGLRVPILGVSSLDAWLDAEPDARAALSRAGAREAFVLVRGDREPAVVAADDLPPATRSEPVVAPADVAEAFGLAAARSPTRAALTIGARAVARLAADPAGDELATLEPTYLRLPRGLERVPTEAVRWQ